MLCKTTKLCNEHNNEIYKSHGSRLHQCNICCIGTVPFWGTRFSFSHCSSYLSNSPIFLMLTFNSGYWTCICSRCAILLFFLCLTSASYHHSDYTVGKQRQSASDMAVHHTKESFTHLSCTVFNDTQQCIYVECMLMHISPVACHE